MPIEHVNTGAATEESDVRDALNQVIDVVNDGGSGPSPSDANPVVASVAAPGVAATFSRGDHVHPVQPSAATLTTQRAFSISGDITAAAVNFNGSAAVVLAAAITAGVVVNADINATAAIARTKLAATGVAAVVAANAADTGDWVADGAAVVALANELKTKLNALIAAA